MALFGLKLWENAFLMIPDISLFIAETIFLAKIVEKIIRRKNYRWKIGKLPVLEELWFFGRNKQMRLEKLPPKF